MSQDFEHLSALVDGELQTNEGATKSDSADIIKQISTDSALAAKWKSYHLTRDLMRNDMSNDIGFDVSSKVAEALADELPIVAPKPSWRDAPIVAAVIPIVKQSSQIAMVACVTALVIFGFQTYNKPEDTAPFKTATPIFGPQGGLAPVNLSATSNIDTQQDRIEQILEQRRQIKALVQDHFIQQKFNSADVSQAQPETAEDAESEQDKSQK